MTLDADIAAILPLLAGAPPMRTGTPEQARAGMRLFTVDLRDPATLEPVASAEDTTYAGAAGQQRARIYRSATPSGATVLFIHGGGYVLGDIDTHDDQARLICNRTGATVVSIDYRLAPEDPFPAGYEDCVRAFEHVKTIAEDPTRIAVAGDSAGGNLAAMVAQYAGTALKAQLLLYPSVDFSEDPELYPSRIDNAEGYFLTTDDMLWFREQYAPGPAATVLHGSLDGLAPAIIATAEYDPLRDEGEAYAAMLEKAGVQTSLTRHAGLIHGFFGFGHLSKGALGAVEEICAELKELLS